MPLSAAGLRAVMKNVHELASRPIEGITVRTSDNLSEVEADIEGPEATPFHGGTFRIVLRLGDSYPEQAPKGFFLTKIFHPNVSDKGEICVNALKKDWDSSLGLAHVLTVIRCLLIEPNPESALNDDAGRLLLEQYDEYFKQARMITAVHARPAAQAHHQQQQQPTPLPSSSSSSSVGLRVASASTSNTVAGAKKAPPVEDGGCEGGAAAPLATKKVPDKKKAALKRL